MAVGESTKLLPWIMGGKKYVRAYLKVSSASESASEASRTTSRMTSFRGRRWGNEGTRRLKRRGC